MNRQQWATVFSHIYFSTDDQFFEFLENNNAYLDTLSKLNNCSSIEIQILTFLILQLEMHAYITCEPHDKEAIYLFLENASINEKDIDKALKNLINKGYVYEITYQSPSEKNIVSGFLANKRKLVDEGLYTPKWDLKFLGLDNFCYN